ncbi:MAG: adenosylcobinamide-GDP ribazoletransferase [Limnothrix sp. CACIAM 69d]|nr:MAG: adenosylcobinamide-GDP ribazoletransferase [Limnothrix sp. CACIAM 69d]
MTEPRRSAKSTANSSPNPAPKSSSKPSPPRSARSPRDPWWQPWRSAGLHLLAGLAFYTVLPVPWQGSLDFRGIARLAPLIGAFLGLLVGLGDGVLGWVGVPILTRSAIAVLGWLALTGGLHLDGAIDTADGLAVQDPQRRLTVMADSTTGAFGAMAAAAILLLKTVALADLAQARWLVIAAVAAWARWGQVVAILSYPYLRPRGKGRMHKDAIRSPWNLLPGWALALSFSALYGVLFPGSWLPAVGLALGGGAIALLTGAWFNRQLGGQTGDTYGAIVEWTEALLLCLMATLQQPPNG